MIERWRHGKVLLVEEISIFFMVGTIRVRSVLVEMMAIEVRIIDIRITWIVVACSLRIHGGDRSEVVLLKIRIGK